MHPLTHEQEQARHLINDVHPKSQHILRTNCEFLSTDTLQHELSNPKNQLLTILDTENTVIGTALLTLESTQPSYLRYLTVHPDWQKQGVGSRLLNLAEEQIVHSSEYKALGLRTAYHPCCPQEQLVAWYQKRGYIYQGEAVPTIAQLEYWEPQFQEQARFKVFQKRLDQRN